MVTETMIAKLLVAFLYFLPEDKEQIVSSKRGGAQRRQSTSSHETTPWSCLPGSYQETNQQNAWLRVPYSVGKDGFTLVGITSKHRRL